MLEVWLPLLSIAAVAMWWYHVLRLRERAVAHARDLCERHGMQLLDDSVALHRLHVDWRHRPPRVTRLPHSGGTEKPGPTALVGPATVPYMLKG